MLEQLRQGTVASRLRALLTDTAIYGTLGVVGRLVGVFLLPVVVRVLSVSEYAVVDTLIVCCEVIIAVSLMGLNQAAGRFIAEEDDPEARRQVVGQSFSVSIGFSLVLCTLLYLAASLPVRPMLWLHEAGYVQAYLLMLASVPCFVILHFAKMLLKWHFQRSHFIALSLFETLSLVVLTLFVILGIDGGVTGLFAARFASLALTALLAAGFCIRYVAVPRSFSSVKELIRFGAPLMTVGFLTRLIPICERLLLTAYLGLGVLGIYAVGQRFARLITLVTSGFELAWAPFAYSIYREHDANKTYNKALLYYCLVVGTACTAFIAVAKPALVLFASEKYMQAVDVLVPLTFAYFIESVCSITGIGVVLSKKTHLSILCNLAEVGTTLVCIVCLIQPLGVVGVAYAVLLGKVTRTGLETWVAQAVYPMRLAVHYPAQVVLTSFAVAILIERLW